MYSWESYVCQPEFVGQFLEQRLDPNLSADAVREVMAAWRETIDRYKILLSEHAALCRTALVLKKSLNLSGYRIHNPNIDANYVLFPRDENSSLPPNYFEAAVSAGALMEDIARRKRIFSDLEIHRFAQGKLLFSLLKLFVGNFIHKIERALRGQYNSPVDWVRSMQWDRDELNFIRVYAAARLPPQIAM